MSSSGTEPRFDERSDDRRGRRARGAAVGAAPLLPSRSRRTAALGSRRRSSAYGGWLERLWLAAPGPRSPVLAPSQALALWRRIVADSPEGAHLLGERGAARLGRRGVRALLRLGRRSRSRARGRKPERLSRVPRTGGDGYLAALADERLDRPRADRGPSRRRRPAPDAAPRSRRPRRADAAAARALHPTRSAQVASIERWSAAASSAARTRDPARRRARRAPEPPSPGRAAQLRAAPNARIALVVPGLDGAPRGDRARARGAARRPRIRRRARAALVRRPSARRVAARRSRARRARRSAPSRRRSRR